MSIALLRRRQKGRPGSAGKASVEEEPASLSDDDRLILRVALISLIFLGLVGVTFVLFIARPVILPIAAAFVIGLMIAPIGERLQKFGVPNAIINIVIMANLASLIVISYIFFAPKLETMFAEMPAQFQKVSQQIDHLLRPLENLQAALGPKTADGKGAETKAFSFDAKQIAVYALAAISPAMTQILIFAFALVMFLIDRPLIKKAIVLAFNSREDRLEAIKFVNQVEASLSQYLSTVFVINAVVGTLTAIVLFLVGMPGYLAIGIVAFLLNFLPFVGPLLLKGALLLLGIAAFPTLLQGVLPVLLYAVIVLVESNFVTPILVGRKFSMPPLLVFISIIFWTWLWGIVGALLAMPLLVIASAIVDRFITEDKTSLPG